MLFVDLWQSPIVGFTHYETCLVSKANYNILNIAYIFKQNSLIIEMLDLGADINLADKNNNTILHLLLEDGNLDLVKKLIKYKPNWNFKNNQNKSPLSILVDKSYVDLLKLLMASNYEIELINK